MSGISKLPSISCDVCKKLVNKVEVYEEWKDQSLRVRAYCHGQKDEMSLSVFAILEYGEELFSETGVAFRSNTQLEKQK